MFFKNELVFLALRFLWLGLVFGVIYIVFSLIVKASKKNLYITNIVGFCFWLAFGLVFSWVSIVMYNYTFCWFGLLFMLIGFWFVKKTQQIFFTKFVLLLYNSVTKIKLKRGVQSGALQTNQKG